MKKPEPEKGKILSKYQLFEKRGVQLNPGVSYQHGLAIDARVGFYQTRSQR